MKHPEKSVPSRLAALDVLRGIAILGTLATNIWIFTSPEGLYGVMQWLPPVETLGDWIERGLQQFATGKFLGLLSIMFGVGLAIQQRSARAAGRAWPGGYLLRAGLLFVDGLLHFLLVAEFDVLMGYAVTGAVVAWVLCTGERSQRAWLWVAAGLHVLMMVLISVAIASTGPDGTGRPAVLDPNPYLEGRWWDLVLFRIEHWVLFRIEPVMIFAMTIALFLLGARLYRAGVFDVAGSALRRRLMLAGLVVWPLDMMIGVSGGLAGLLFTRYLTAPLVSLGLLALVAEFYLRRPVPGFVGRRLAEVGRTALSCYVLQNLLASAVCYGWGLGLSGMLSDGQRVPATVLLYLLLCPAIMLLAHLWLRFFRRGPLEAVWAGSYRVLARGRAA